jgi:type IV secretory pathway VirB2 component (pilin)
MGKSQVVRKFAKLVPFLALALVVEATPLYAGFESSLITLKDKLTGVILPLLSVMGMGIAALSFFTGNPNAKQHVIYAVFGCLIGFGAQAIVDFIAQTVN